MSVLVSYNVLHISYMCCITWKAGIGWGPRSIVLAYVHDWKIFLSMFQLLFPFECAKAAALQTSLECYFLRNKAYKIGHLEMMSFLITSRNGWITLSQHYRNGRSFNIMTRKEEIAWFDGYSSRITTLYLDASSSPSCHCSCQRMATRMSSSDTMMACCTRALLCSLMFCRILSAASFLLPSWLLVATVSG